MSKSRIAGRFYMAFYILGVLLVTPVHIYWSIRVSLVFFLHLIENVSRTEIRLLAVDLQAL